MPIKKKVFLIFLPILTVYLLALPIPPMEMDAAQYAAMAVEMLDSANWLHFTDLGNPYLDKPPLVFWTAGICYKLFGINAISYKLPSLLFWLLGIYSVYRFAKLYYNENIALTAMFVLATSQSAFLLTNDCRTDTLLIGAVTFSILAVGGILGKQKIALFCVGFCGDWFSDAGKRSDWLDDSCLDVCCPFFAYKTMESLLALAVAVGNCYHFGGTFSYDMGLIYPV